MSCVAIGCTPKEGANEEGASTEDDSSTGGAMTTAVTMTTIPAEDSGSTSGGETDSVSSAGSSSSGDSSSTGSPEVGDCVDEDIGMATGASVASGSTVDAGNDFNAFDCFGGEDVMDSGGDGVTTAASGGTSSGGGTTDPGGGPTSDTDGAAGDDYVIHWSPPATGPYVLSLEGSDFDTFALVTAPECGGEIYDCNDDCFDLQSGLTYQATAGVDVFIVIDGFGGAVGNFALSITPGSELLCESGESSDVGGGSGDPTSTSGMG